MMITLLIATFIGLQAAFIWARYTTFRIDGPTPHGVRLIEASTLACLAVGVALMASRGSNSAAFDSLALVTAAASAAVFTWALRSVLPRQLSAAFSPDMPIELVRRGAFHYVRNPFYLSYLLAHALPLIASRSPWALLTLAWMGALYARATKLEERKFLASPLADDYRRYVRTTGRFIPRLGAWRREV